MLKPRGTSKNEKQKRFLILAMALMAIGLTPTILLIALKLEQLRDPRMIYGGLILTFIGLVIALISGRSIAKDDYSIYRDM